MLREGVEKLQDGGIFSERFHFVWLALAAGANVSNSGVRAMIFDCTSADSSIVRWVSVVEQLNPRVFVIDGARTLSVVDYRRFGPALPQR